MATPYLESSRTSAITSRFNILGRLTDFASWLLFNRLMRYIYLGISLIAIGSIIASLVLGSAYVIGQPLLVFSLVALPATLLFYGFSYIRAKYYKAKNIYEKDADGKVVTAFKNRFTYLVSQGEYGFLYAEKDAMRDEAIKAFKANLGKSLKEKIRNKAFSTALVGLGASIAIGFFSTPIESLISLATSAQTGFSVTLAKYSVYFIAIFLPMFLYRASSVIDDHINAELEVLETAFNKKYGITRKKMSDRLCSVFEPALRADKKASQSSPLDYIGLGYTREKSDAYLERRAEKERAKLPAIETEIGLATVKLKDTIKDAKRLNRVYTTEKSKLADLEQERTVLSKALAENKASKLSESDPDTTSLLSKAINLFTSTIDEYSAESHADLTQIASEIKEQKLILDQIKKQIEACRGENVQISNELAGLEEKKAFFTKELNDFEEVRTTLLAEKLNTLGFPIISSVAFSTKDTAHVKAIDSNGKEKSVRAWLNRQTKTWSILSYQTAEACMAALRNNINSPEVKECVPQLARQLFADKSKSIAHIISVGERGSDKDFVFYKPSTHEYNRITWLDDHKAFVVLRGKVVPGDTKISPQEIISRNDAKVVWEMHLEDNHHIPISFLPDDTDHNHMMRNEIKQGKIPRNDIYLTHHIAPEGEQITTSPKSIYKKTV